MKTTSSLDWIARAWSTSIGQLSHTLATKMATLQLKQQGLQKIIPSLLKGYHIAVEQHLMEDEISAKALKHIEDMHNFDEQLTPIFKLLEQLNNYSTMIAHHNESKPSCLSAQQFLDDLITNYAFNKAHRKI